MSERNKTFVERELSIRKNEDELLKLAEQLAELAEQNSEKESRLRRATFDFLIREAKQRELQEKEEARIASEKLELANERQADAKRFQTENEILATRESNQQRKEDKFRNDNKIFSSVDEDKNESLLTGREGHQIEVTLTRVNTVVSEKGKRKRAARKSLKKEKKTKEIMRGDHEWDLERAFCFITLPFKV